MKNPRGFAGVLALWLGLAAAPALAATYTIPRDQSGVPAAECAFLGSTGVSTLCSTTDPLPTTVVGGGGPTPPTTPTTDSTGWAQQWFSGAQTGGASNFQLYPIFVADNSLVAFARAEVGNSADEWVSANKGRTWTKRITWNFSGENWNSFQFAIRLTDGSYLVGGGLGNTLPGQTGVGRISPTGSSAHVLLPGIPGALVGGGVSAWQQGSTVLLTWIKAGDGSRYMCRSTDTGATFTCDAVNYSAFNMTGKEVDSPAPNIWIRAKADGVERSINDGGTWAAVLSGTVGGAVVECISSTVCLFTNGASVYRSTNAGASWVLQYTPVETAPGFAGFVDYGSGAVALIPSGQPANIYFSQDSGATWTPTFLVNVNALRCVVPCQTTASGGSAAYDTNSSATLGRNAYSPAIGNGEQRILGADGTPMLVDGNGFIGVTQRPGGTSTSVTGAWWVNNTDGTGFVGSANNPFQVAANQNVLLSNSSTVGAVNTAVVTTITPVATARAHLYSFSAFCSAGSATVTVQDGATTIWRAPAGVVTTTLFSVTWPVALAGTTGNSLVVTLTTCGAGNTGTLQVQADRR